MVAATPAEFNTKTRELQQLERARNAIRQKHKLLKVARMETNLAASETFKPIVQPLERLIDVAAMVDAPSAKQKNRKSKLRRYDTTSGGEGEEEEDDSFDTSSSTTGDTIVATHPTDQAAADYDLAEAAAAAVAVEEQPQRSVTEYVKMLQASDTRSLDTQVGVRLNRNNLMIGNYAIAFDGRKIRVAGMEFDETPGLVELLFAKSPNESRFTPEDEANFVKIVLATQAHHTSYKLSAARRIYNEKYKKFIKEVEDEILRQQQQVDSEERKRLEQVKLEEAAIAAVEQDRRLDELLRQPSTRKLRKQDLRRQSTGSNSSLKKKKKKGGQILPYKIALKHANKMDYVYWNDPNELIDRLQLLFAETAAGNAASHTNEISSIVEELREAGIIY